MPPLFREHSKAGTPTPSLSASPSQSSTVEVTVTPVLRAEMTRHGLDPADLMDGDCLKVTGQNVKQVLRLLNEDLFQGGFSHQPYAASTKRAL